MEDKQNLKQRLLEKSKVEYHTPCEWDEVKPVQKEPNTV
jgi:hypothetical protein